MSELDRANRKITELEKILYESKVWPESRPTILSVVQQRGQEFYELPILTIETKKNGWKILCGQATPTKSLAQPPTSQQTVTEELKANAVLPSPPTPTEGK